MQKTSEELEGFFEGCTVRELVNAHLDYLLEAKPCWMMSPTSLANLIDSDIFEEHGVPFDLVIFDESSQIRVLDGLLSMSFGKQVIIVGDKNQLPPTDFFAGFANPEADVEAQDFGISESLLNEFEGVFDEDKTQVMLMSHYRSETPDLTRSRSGLTVVSSLKAADLEASGAQSKGFQCLKALLLGLENTEQARTFGIGSKRFERKTDGVSNVVYCDSPFEEQVVEFLENEGYEIECQYGAGNFWLDIVVKERGRNLLAIECDGAGYHSSLVARTRDRARQRVLEKLGWRIHRVWSTNWWFFEQQEKEAIVAAINAARAAVKPQRQ